MRHGPILGTLADDDTQGRPHALGRAGEQLAADHLEKQGWIVLARNWRCAQGELDIVATDGERVVFCEVKTRSGVDYGGPLNAVDQHKILRVRQLARAWLDEHRLHGCRVRFDVISVLWPPGGRARLDHLPEAF
jgi:putative endonuclease